MVLHAFDVVMNNLLIEAKQLQEIGQEPVPARNVARKRLSRGREDKAAIFLVFKQALGIEPLHHVAHAGLRNLQACGDVDDTSVAF